MFLIAASLLAALPAAYILHRVLALPGITKKKPARKKNGVWFFFIAAVLFLFAAALASGILPYRIDSVVSESMTGTFDRGSVVIIKKLGHDSVVSSIEVGDVIYYRNGTAGNMFIIHRVVEIIDSPEIGVKYITKGDNNDYNDSKPVNPEQVSGIVNGHIPMLGFLKIELDKIIKRVKI